MNLSILLPTIPSLLTGILLLPRFCLALFLLSSAFISPRLAIADDAPILLQSAQSDDDIVALDVRLASATLTTGEPLQIKFDWRIAGFVEPEKACWLYLGKKYSGKEDWLNVEVENMEGVNETLSTPKYRDKSAIGIMRLSKSDYGPKPYLYSDKCFASPALMSKPGTYKVTVHVDLVYSVTKDCLIQPQLTTDGKTMRCSFTFPVTVLADDGERLINLVSQWEMSVLAFQGKGGDRSIDAAVEALFNTPEATSGPRLRRLIMASRIGGAYALPHYLPRYASPLVFAALEEKIQTKNLPDFEYDATLSLLRAIYVDSDKVTEQRIEKLFKRLGQPKPTKSLGHGNSDE